MSKNLRIVMLVALGLGAGGCFPFRFGHLGHWGGFAVHHPLAAAVVTGAVIGAAANAVMAPVAESPPGTGTVIAAPAPVAFASAEPMPMPEGGECDETCAQAQAQQPMLGAAPSGPPLYQTWIAARQPCGVREYHVRCVRSQAGETCFFETDDGAAYDCGGAVCAAAPGDLSAWCAAAAAAN